MSVKEISDFIIEAKSLISNGKYDFVPRTKNLQALAKRGFSIENVKSEILSLEVMDYYKGPKQDFDNSRPGDIWEFKKCIDGIQFDIKLKIANENGENILKCLSFHDSEFT